MPVGVVGMVTTRFEDFIFGVVGIVDIVVVVVVADVVVLVVVNLLLLLLVNSLKDLRNENLLVKLRLNVRGKNCPSFALTRIKT